MNSKKPTETLPIVEEISRDFSLTNILLFVVIVLNAFGLYLLTGNSVSLPGGDSFGIRQTLEEFEYEKAGGRANYELLTKAQQLSMQDPQNPSNIVAMRQYVASFSKNNSGSTDASEDINTPKNEALKTLSSGAVDQIISSLSIEGNKSADIFVIEYSDMECPFCMRQYHDTKLGSTLLAEYGDKVAFAFKNNRGVNHPGTEAKALAVLCAKKVGNDANYIAFYQAIMDGSTNISGVYDVTKLSDIAKELSLDMKKWQTCLDSKEMLATFEKETKEAQGFELGGTPGTLILNVKTGKYTTVEGAYPYQTFRSKIESLMK